MSASNGSRWSAATASVRGASHDRSGLPNQDAVRSSRVDGPVPGLVAAVADGHGGARYVRSDVGSRLGVEVACEVAAAALTELGPQPDARQIERHLAGPVVQAIVSRWRALVLAHLAEHPFTTEEATRAGAPLDAEPLISYGATLILAVLGPTWVGLLQIGDGDATTVTGDAVGDPVPGDDRLVGGETTSLCLPTAVDDARVASIVGALPDLVILTSDGYANSFASPSWRTDAGTDLRDQIRRDGLADVARKLPAWLADSATAGGDDVSMALIQRAAANAVATATVRAATAPDAAAAVTSPTSTTASRSSGGGRKAAMFGIGAAALVIGLIAGGAGSELLADDATTTIPTTTTTAPPESETPSSDAPAIAPGERVIVADGVDGDAVVVINGNELLSDPDEPRMEVIGPVSLAAGTTALPEGWAIKDGHLQYKRKDVAAFTYWAVYRDRLWVTDGERTLVLDPETGKPPAPSSTAGTGGSTTTTDPKK